MSSKNIMLGNIDLKKYGNVFEEINLNLIGEVIIGRPL